MKGGTNICAGIKAVQKTHTPGKYILPGEFCGPQILSVGKQDIHRHGDDLGDDDIHRELFEAVNIVKQENEQTACHQHIPKYIGDDKDLAKGDQIIQKTVDGGAAFDRDQIFRKEIQEKVADPAQQEQ